MNLNLSPIQDELNKLEEIRNIVIQDLATLRSINWTSLEQTCSAEEIERLKRAYNAKRIVLERMETILNRTEGTKSSI